MYEEIFLRIGGNVNVWSKKINRFLTSINVVTYKYYTLCKGLIKLDFSINVEFMATVLFISYDVERNIYVLIGNTLFTLLVLWNFVYGQHIVSVSLKFM